MPSTSHRGPDWAEYPRGGLTHLCSMAFVLPSIFWKSVCQGHGSWWISVLLLSVKILMCSPSQSFPSLEYLFDGRNSVVAPKAHALSNRISSLSPAFPVCALLGHTMSPMLATIFHVPSCGRQLENLLQQLPPRLSLLLTLPWPVPYLTTTFLPLPI